LQWVSATPDAMSDPVVELIGESFMACRPIRRVLVPTVLTDDELRRIGARVTVMIGDREVIYRGGPQAALARAQKHIPYAQRQLMPNANHTLTLDCPKPVTTEMLAALA